MQIVCYNLNQIVNTSIINLLKQFKPDILILQEVMLWKDVEYLAKEMNMNCDKKSWSNYGVCVMSKFPITDNFKLKNCVGIKTNDIWVFSLHLDDLNYKKDEQKRIKELKYILANLPKTDKAILAGDFNSVSHLDIYSNKLLPSHLLEDWIDCQANKPYTRGTWIPSETLSRIDRIYCRGLKIGNGGIIDKKDVGLTRWPTGRDHRLLWQQIYEKNNFII